jgi:hypothetical protein
MTYRISVSSNHNYSVKVSQPQSLKANFRYTTIMPQNLNELSDVQISGANDKYVLMYDAVSGKWKDVDPDVVLSSAVITQSGLPQDFINTLDVDLDNKIDLDAGEF